MNKVELIGRLTKEPTVNMSNGGSSIARFSLAVDRRIKAEGQPDADFPNIVAFGKTAEFIEKYFHKGMKMAMTGRIQTGSYEKNGQKVYTTDVIAEEVEFCEAKNNSSNADSTQKDDGFMTIPEGTEEEMPFR